MSKHEFNADVNQLIQLVTHSIYSNKEIFLRELISNSSDALAKAKIHSLQDTNYLGDDHQLHIIIDVDEKNKMITITDNGIGMSKEEVISNIGTIAKSGTKEFFKKITTIKKTEQSNELIGQFGIGFYSVFMVADNVQLETKTNAQEAIYWSSNGKDNYEIKESDKATRGTSIRIFLNDENKDFANAFRIQSLIKKHSNYIPFPILMKDPKQDNDSSTDDGSKSIKIGGVNYEQINKAQSIRTKQKTGVAEEDYQEYYQSISFDSQKPLDHIHIHSEGSINFKALLYIPQKTNPFAHMMTEDDFGPSLYVQNVLIKEKCKELLPQWLRFVKGVVETPDLPLNISREILQDNALIAKIQSSLVKKILETLKYHLTQNTQNYQEFHSNYAKILKEGIHFDRSNKEKIAECVMFYSLKQSGCITLDQYIQHTQTKDSKAKIKKSDKEKENKDQSQHIYYLTGTSLDELKQSPYLEQFNTSTIDVLLMNDAIDERVVQALLEYKDYKLINAQHASITPQKKEQKEKKKITDKLNKDNKDFLAFIKSTIGGEKIDTIQLTDKLTNTLAVLTIKEGQASAQMEKYMKAMGHDVPESKKDLQLNADHPLLQKMIKSYHKNPQGKTLKELVLYTYEQALLLQGGNIENFNSFFQRVNELIK